MATANQTFHAQRRSNGQPILIVTSMLFVALLLGAVIGFLPAAFTIRLVVLPIFLGFISLAWMVRSKKAGMPGWVVLTTLYSTAALSVLWPRYIFFSIGGPSVNPLTLLTLTSIFVIVAWIAYSPELTKRLGALYRESSPVFALFVLLLMWQLITSLTGTHPVISIFEFVRELGYLTSFFLIGSVMAAYPNGSRNLMRCLLVCGFIVVLAGCVEWVRQTNPFVKLAGSGLDASATETLKIIAADKIRGGSYRIQSTFDHPLTFGQFLAALIPIAAFAIGYERAAIWRWLGVMIVPLALFALYKTDSRAGFVSIGLALIYLCGIAWVKLMRSRGYGKAIAIAVLPLLLLGAFALVIGVESLALGRNRLEVSSSSVRLKMVSLGVRALESSPVFGFGHSLAITKAGIMDPMTRSATIDSLPLSLALDSGYVGLGIFLLLIGVFIWKGTASAMRLKGVDSARQAVLVSSVLAMFVAYVTLSIPSNLTLFWLLFAASLPAIGASSRLASSAIST